MYSRLYLLFSPTFFDYFGSTPQNITEQRNFYQREALNYTYYIVNSIFGNLLNSYGNQNTVLVDGAIYFKTARRIYLLIELCTFYNCSTGGIMFDCSLGGSCILKKICAFECFSDILVSNNGQFTFQSCASDQLNVLSFVSINKCPKDYSGTRKSPAFIRYGRQIIEYSNFSNNKVYQVAAFHIQTPHSFNSSFCTIVDNLPHHSITLYIIEGSGKKTYHQMNLIRNSSPIANGVITFRNFNDPNQKIEFINCIYNENMNTLIFTENRLDFLWVIGGWINHASFYSLTNTNSFSSVWRITFTSLILTSSSTNTYDIDHLRTYLCNPSNQILGEELTPCQTLPPPFPTPTACSYEESMGLSITNLRTYLHLFQFSINMLILFN